MIVIFSLLYNNFSINPAINSARIYIITTTVNTPRADNLFILISFSIRFKAQPEPAFFFGGDATGLLDQIACGCHLVLFNTGRGHVGGTPVAPILKLTGNQETFDMLSHGTETKAEAAERLWGLIQRICNGEEVHAERVGHRQGTLFFNYQDPRRVVPCRY